MEGQKLPSGVWKGKVKMEKIAVYPGSFDPITNGHLDIIERSSKIFDKLIIAILRNPDKKNPLFDVEERIELIRKSTAHIKNVEVESFDGLLVNYMKERNANVIIKGLRAVSDFEYELQMAHMNHKLDPNVETLFMMTSAQNSFLSSSIVKQVGQFKGCIKGLVPDVILKDVIRQIDQKYNK